MASRIQQVAVNFTGVGIATPWIRHDYFQDPFNVTLAVYLDSVINATLKVQFVSDDVSHTAQRSVNVVQAASTTATVTDYGPYTINGGPANANWGGPFGHGLLTGDQVFLEGTQSGVDSGLNSYPVTVTGANTYTVVTPVNQTINVTAKATTGRVLDHATLTAVTARAVGNYGFPVWMSRLIATAVTTPGKAFLVAIQGR